MSATVSRECAVEPWPEGVFARHLTWAGAHLGDHSLTVDISEDDLRRAVCRGCGDSHNQYEKPSVSEWAMSHAAACRALPRPGVA
ncbi:hypothetical protein OG897_13480 [Streptomyces sp. NBC_00237]|uniref:hypothetical protein n=1 Tax=Streptomyces sp. NBC_00237 TaxID=2975687 RepID=UPI0022557E98|nr:hypothetical protein [Streptomyces sp. NBC_00237]MCX5202455.1 hypothetical protein [Streptomyces sp. NBC_00237]